MSSAKKGKEKDASCWHVSSFFLAFFHRAKPVSEMERSGIERHCGVERATTSFSKRGWSEAESSLFVEAKIERSEIKPVCRSEDRAKRDQASLQKRR